jgi:hypothetical protein
MVINTPNITAKNTIKVNLEPEFDPMERVVNLNFSKPNKGIGYDRVSFKSQKFYEEALKISKDP